MNVVDMENGLLIFWDWYDLMPRIIGHGSYGGSSVFSAGKSSMCPREFSGDDLTHDIEFNDAKSPERPRSERRP